MKWVHAMLAGVAVLPLYILNTGCASASKETYNATISYVLQPTQQLPEGVHQLAILDQGVKVDVSGDEARSKKWAKICADMMEQMILDSQQKYGTQLSLAKRRDTEKVMAEQDLKAAGLTQDSAAGATGKLSDVQALITSDLNIQVETNKSKKTTIDVTSLYGGGGHGWGHGGGTLNAREADAISRNITLQCKFSMIDATTSKSLFEYAPKPLRKHDSKKPSPVFGRSSGEADLDPVDMYIGELVEQGTREFISTFAPCQVEYNYELTSGSSKESADGIRALRADNYEGAMSLLQTAVQNDANDHRSAFALGVASELTQDWEGALKWYRQAASMPDLDDSEMAMYLAAKERVAAHKDRIQKTKKA